MLSADELKKCLSAVVEQRGVPNHSLIRKLFAEINAVSSPRQLDSADLQHLENDIGSREVAEMLGWNVRRVQRRYRELGGRKVGSTIVFHESVIREHVQGSAA